MQNPKLSPGERRTAAQFIEIGVLILALGVLLIALGLENASIVMFVALFVWDFVACMWGLSVLRKKMSP